MVKHHETCINIYIFTVFINSNGIGVPTGIIILLVKEDLCPILSEWIPLGQIMSASHACYPRSYNCNFHTHLLIPKIPCYSKTNCTVNHWVMQGIIVIICIIKPFCYILIFHKHAECFDTKRNKRVNI